MTDEKLENLHLHLMNDFLPVGLGVIERVRKEGLKKLIKDMQAEKNPILDLRSEGEPMATSLRDQLDKIQPGLGNPAIPVEVSPDLSNDKEYIDDKDPLIITLNNINTRLDLLANYYKDDSTNKESPS